MQVDVGPVGAEGLLGPDAGTDAEDCQRAERAKFTRQGVNLLPQLERRELYASMERLPGIATVLARMTTAPVRILAGSRLAAADLGCALTLQLETMHASQRDDRLSTVSVSPADAPGDHVRVVIGGPLVRASLSIKADEACRLTDEGGSGWHFCADEGRVAEAEDEEQLGSVSVATTRDDVLFVVGTRDAGTVAALRWLRHTRKTQVPDVPWVLVDARCRW